MASDPTGGEQGDHEGDRVDRQQRQAGLERAVAEGGL
jgi:hypothetical protein